MIPTISKIESNLNDLSLLHYLELLGYKPIAQQENSTDYQVYLNCAGELNLKIDHKTNRWMDQANNREGTLVDFACLLFECTPRELSGNIALYRIDQLMSTNI